MNEKERLQLESELLMTCSKAQAINKYIDELEESSKLSELWCKSQQENEKLKEKNTIYKSTIKGQYNKIKELQNSKRISKEVHKKRNKKLQEENERLKEDIKHLVNIINNNCLELTTTEEEFESLKRWNNE